MWQCFVALNEPKNKQKQTKQKTKAEKTQAHPKSTDIASEWDTGTGIFKKSFPGNHYAARVVMPWIRSWEGVNR